MTDQTNIVPIDEPETCESCGKTYALGYMRMDAEGLYFCGYCWHEITKDIGPKVAFKGQKGGYTKEELDEAQRKYNNLGRSTDNIDEIPGGGG